MIQAVKLRRIGQVRLSNFSNLLKTDKIFFQDFGAVVDHIQWGRFRNRS